jgi:hypothetical protein
MENCAEIYLITCKTTKKKYVGQTVCFSKKKDGSLIKRGTQGRWNAHIYSRKKGTIGQCRLLAEVIAEYGKDDFIVETLLIINEKYIDHYEKIFIKAYNTLHPYGYNLQEGGSHGRHHEETKKLISKSNTGKIRTEEHKRHMSEIKMVYKGLPKYIYVLNNSDRNVHGYRILKHPTLPEKKFLSKLLTMEEKLQQAIDYINGVESSIVIPKIKHDKEWHKNNQDSRKKEKNLPEYIYETNDSRKNAHGYIVRNHPSLNKKQFVSQKLSMEEKLQLAINYLTII